MILLGIDSASAACSAAVAGPDGIRAHRFEAMQRGQAEALAPMIADVLDDAGLAATGLDAVAVTVGPGAFTGVRIGLSAARALGLAAAKPVVGVTTFAAIAGPWVGGEAGDILCVVESRRTDFFVQMFDGQTGNAGPPAALDGADVAAHVAAYRRSHGPLTVIGDGAGRLIESGALRTCEPVAATGNDLPDARHVCGAARRLIDTNGLPQLHERPSPLYLRPPDVRLPGLA